MPTLRNMRQIQSLPQQRRTKRPWYPAEGGGVFDEAMKLEIGMNECISMAHFMGMSRVWI